jgi:antitoxin ChpS
MKLNIQKWGNSAAIRLPSAMLSQLGVKVGDVLDVDMAEKIARLQAAKPKYELAALLAEMPEGLPMIEGWDDMMQVGKEVY